MSRHVFMLNALFAVAALAHGTVGWAESSKPNIPAPRRLNNAAAGKLGFEDSAQPTATTATPGHQSKPAKQEKQSKQTQPAAAAEETKTLSGISILGNQEAPKSLVIVPWKSSEIGAMPGLQRLLDDSIRPVDKDVFMRELDYYEIRSGAK